MFVCNLNVTLSFSALSFRGKHSGRFSFNRAKVSPYWLNHQICNQAELEQYVCLIGGNPPRATITQGYQMVLLPSASGTGEECRKSLGFLWQNHSRKWQRFTHCWNSSKSRFLGIGFGHAERPEGTSRFLANRYPLPKRRRSICIRPSSKGGEGSGDRGMEIIAVAL